MVSFKPCLATAMSLAMVASVARGDTENPFRQAGAVQTAEVIATPPPDDSQHRPMQSLGVDIRLPNGEMPKGVAPATLTTTAFAGDMPRPWPTQVYNWQAAATRHQPLYFEEINAERYGYSRNWVAQPFVSTAHFFATIPALPYLKAANCPWECQYTLGHYRPGSCPPDRFHCWPADGLGAVAEAGSAAWLVFVLP